MSIDWPARIVELYRAKEAFAEADDEDLFPLRLPSVAASAEEIATTQERLGLTLDAQHRGFLLHANGWVAFTQVLDLLSTEQLAGGEHVEAFRAWIASAPPQAAEAGYTVDTLLPIGVDLEYPMYFAMPIVGDRVGPEVVWLDPSGVVEMFETFEMFVASMVAYTVQSRENLAAG